MNLYKTTIIPSAYKGKKIFLTGHTGFKGSWLLYWLNQIGADVKGYALEPQNKNDLFYLIKGETLCDNIIADIRDHERLSKEIVNFEPDYIFHLAAQPLVRLSYLNPRETFETNIMGTFNVLESLKSLQKKCTVLIITTDKVYENKEWIYPYRENDQLGGYDPYSASKSCAELIVSSFRNSFFHKDMITQHGKGIAVARAGNVIGGGDWSTDRLIPDIIRSIINNEKVILRNPKATRPWQHVLEAIYGYLLLGASLNEDPLNFSEEWNFGPALNTEITVETLVKLSLQYLNEGEYEIDNSANHPHEAKLLLLDTSKANKILDWWPTLNGEEAVKKTLEWYKQYYTQSENIIDEQLKQFVST